MPWVKPGGRATGAAAVKGLRSQDLRRWFASVLEDLGDGEEEAVMPREVVKYLLGYQMSEVAPVSCLLCRVRVTTLGVVISGIILIYASRWPVRFSLAPIACDRSAVMLTYLL